MNKMLGVIVVAAGKGRRMGGPVSKQYERIHGRAILLYTLYPLLLWDKVHEIIIVISQEEEEIFLDRVWNQIKNKEKLRYVSGGKERYDSVHNGFQAVSKKCRYVMIHDGVRPFVSQAELEKLYQCAVQCDAAILARKAKDTIKELKPDSSIIRCTPDRSAMVHAQTPQCFSTKVYADALAWALEEDEIARITDDASMVERYGHAVSVVEGEEKNIKITTPLDRVLAQWLIERMDYADWNRI